MTRSPWLLPGPRPIAVRPALASLLRNALAWIVVIAVMLTACARTPLPAAQGSGTGTCGDLCTTLPCPQAYRCSVTSGCQRRCEPEPAASGLPWR